MRDVVLYHGLASTCSKKVRLALFEKGVSFESRLLDLQKFEQHEPSYLAINPKGVVPTLVDEGRAVIESSVIIQYVDEAFAGPTLAPTDPLARARMRLWLRYSDEVAYDAVNALTWQRMRHRAADCLTGESVEATLARIPTEERRERWRRMATGGYTEDELAAATNKMRKCLDELEKSLALSDWLVDDNFTLADIAVLPFADRIGNLRPDFLEGADRRGVRAWLLRAGARPSFNRAFRFTEDPRAAELPNF